ncbi:MAG: hypothetical protein EP321_16565 [Sphingomonadales bacterium]|nr:MAG: hypothetical protein EP345_07255 [Sphingomonadales bacterium]TNF01601.1 MAG: hypothetical protein EP321_16565 [Sphingomonadales bacterium]
MYEYIDRPVETLADGPHFLVWAMRRWVQAMHDRRCPACVIGPAFAKWRMMPGLAPFQAMMAILNIHALRNLRFGPVCCGPVSEDEAMLLTFITGVRGRSSEEMAETLALIVERDQVQSLQGVLSRLADAMATVKILPEIASRPADS